jgi:hypothetical protein
LARHHAECWDEDGACASCRATVSLERVEAEATTMPHPARPPAEKNRLSLLATVASLAVFGALYRALVVGHLEQTAALFIGLPAALAVMLAATSPAKTVTGTLVKGTTLSMLLAGTVLGEGLICVLMAAPLFYLVAISVGLVIDWARSPRSKALGLAILIPLCLEGVAGELPRQETVSVERVLEATPAQVKDRLARTPRFDPAARPWFLSLGFPAPGDARGDGLSVGRSRTIRFAGSEGEGVLQLQVEAYGPGLLRMRVARDTTPMAHWLELQTSEIRWSDAGAGRTRVRWTARYRRLLDPAWYFAPLQRFAVAQAIGFHIEQVLGRP